MQNRGERERHRKLWGERRCRRAYWNPDIDSEKQVPLLRVLQQQVLPLQVLQPRAPLLLALPQGVLQQQGLQFGMLTKACPELTLKQVKLKTYAFFSSLRELFFG